MVPIDNPAGFLGAVPGGLLAPINRGMQLRLEASSESESEDESHGFFALYLFFFALVIRLVFLTATYQDKDDVSVYGRCWHSYQSSRREGLCLQFLIVDAVMFR